MIKPPAPVVGRLADQAEIESEPADQALLFCPKEVLLIRAPRVLAVCLV